MLAGGTATTPAPPVTCGMPFSVLSPHDLCNRSSPPPLKACLPFVQLSVSAYVHSEVLLPFVLLPGLSSLLAMLIGMVLKRTGYPLALGRKANVSSLVDASS